MDLPKMIWQGYRKTAFIAQMHGYSKRHMLRILKDWYRYRVVVHMKGFYPDDYRLFDMWSISSTGYELRKAELIEIEQETKKSNKETS